MVSSSKRIIGILRNCLIPLCLCSILIAAGIIWHWFYVLAVGVILAISTIVYILTAIVKKEDGESLGTGCLLTVIFAVLVYFYHDDRFIIPEDDKQHIYSDCRTIMLLQSERSKQVPAFGWSDDVLSESVIEVTELEGFFHFAFSDCPECKERERKEEERLEEERIELRRQELKGYLQGLIDRLDSGEDPEDIEWQLEKDWYVEPEDNYTPGVPLRYQ